MTDGKIDAGEYLVDPLGTMDRMRAQGWLADGMFAPMVVRHEEVRQVLTDPGFRASFADLLDGAGVTSGPFREWMAGSPLNRDGEDHRAWRALLTRTFTSRSVQRLRPLLRTAAHELIDRFADRGRCEFMAEFADVYPSIGLCELIGVPTEDRDRFRAWSSTVGLGFNILELPARRGEIDEATVQLNDYAAQLVAVRRREPRDDLVSRIAATADEEGGIWDDRMIAATVAGLVFAGHDTTKNQLGWMVSVLADRPALWEAVADASVDVTALVDEVMRYRSSVTGVNRTATATFEHDGQRIDAGTMVFPMVWAANHDPAAFPRPNEVDVEANAGTPPATFGHGAHHCIGANLARAELQEALQALAARMSPPTVEDGALWRAPIGLTGPEVLPISFRPR
jgi:cytochrome P450